MTELRASKIDRDSLFLPQISRTSRQTPPRREAAIKERNDHRWGSGYQCHGNKAAALRWPESALSLLYETASGRNDRIAEPCCPVSGNMDSLAKNIIACCWGVFFVVWVLAAIFTKRTRYRESGTERLRHIIPIVIGWYLLFRGGRLPDPFNLRIIP